MPLYADAPISGDRLRGSEIACSASSSRGLQWTRSLCHAVATSLSTSRGIRLPGCELRCQDGSLVPQALLPCDLRFPHRLASKTEASAEFNAAFNRLYLIASHTCSGLRTGRVSWVVSQIATEQAVGKRRVGCLLDAMPTSATSTEKSRTRQVAYSLPLRNLSMARARTSLADSETRENHREMLR